MKDAIVKIVVFVPVPYADAVRKAMGEAGAGAIGNYKFSSFSVKGFGRFLPIKGARPAIGKIGKLEKVAEERIETVCRKKDLAKVIKAIKKVHPYEEIALDIYPLLPISHNSYYKE